MRKSLKGNPNIIIYLASVVNISTRKNTILDMLGLIYQTASKRWSWHLDPKVGFPNCFLVLRQHKPSLNSYFSTKKNNIQGYSDSIQYWKEKGKRERQQGEWLWTSRLKFPLATPAGVGGALARQWQCPTVLPYLKYSLMLWGFPLWGCFLKTGSGGSGKLRLNRMLMTDKA